MTSLAYPYIPAQSQIEHTPLMSHWQLEPAQMTSCYDTGHEYAIVCELHSTVDYRFSLKSATILTMKPHMFCLDCWRAFRSAMADGEQS